jgi:large subunit ribosomal protein L5
LTIQVEPLSNRELRIAKVVLNIGVGRSGESLERAKRVLEVLSGQKPATTFAKMAIRDFGIHKGEPIGTMTTIRGQRATESLNRLLSAKEMKVLEKSFDDGGNFSFGIKEHIEIPGIKYDPEIGIWGLNVSVALDRPGYRIKSRRRLPKKIGKRQRVTKTDAIEYARNVIRVEVVEELG